MDAQQTLNFWFFIAEGVSGYREVDVACCSLSTDAVGSLSIVDMLTNMIREYEQTAATWRLIGEGVAGEREWTPRLTLQGDTARDDGCYFFLPCPEWPAPTDDVPWPPRPL
jgi:hypothetical protein